MKYEDYAFWKINNIITVSLSFWTSLDTALKTFGHKIMFLGNAPPAHC